MTRQLTDALRRSSKSAPLVGVNDQRRRLSHRSPARALASLDSANEGTEDTGATIDDSGVSSTTGNTVKKKLGPKDEGCITAAKPLMPPFTWKPFMDKQKMGQDGFQFCIPLWPVPRIRICGAITANVELKVNIGGKICIASRKLGVTLVPSASLVVIASVFIDIIIARGGAKARVVFSRGIARTFVRPLPYSDKHDVCSLHHRHAPT